MHHQTCLNCGKSLHGDYCSHCGQKAKTGRITLAFLWEEAFHFFTHMESGFFFTSFRLLVAPGKTVEAFISGKRKSYQQPVSYFLIWTTLYILTLYWIDRLFGENTVISYMEYFGPGATTKYAISHLSLVLTFVIPFQALYLLLFIAPGKYNYYESLVAAIYAVGTIIQLQFLFAVLALLIHFFTGASTELMLSDTLKGGYLIWFVAGLTRRQPVKKRFLRAALFVVLAFGTFTLWRLYGVPQFIHWVGGH